MPLPILGAALVIKAAAVAATVAAAAAAGAVLYQRARLSRSAEGEPTDAPAALQALEHENAELRRRLERLERGLPGQPGQQRP